MWSIYADDLEIECYVAMNSYPDGMRHAVYNNIYACGATVALAITRSRDRDT